LRTLRTDVLPDSARRSSSAINPPGGWWFWGCSFSKLPAGSGPGWYFVLTECIGTGLTIHILRYAVHEDQPI